MKKNKMMRLASVLLVLTLLSTSVISGTFAKYTTQDSASDSARVAKWGVELQVFGNLYGDTYKDLIVEETDASLTVQSVDQAADVVAPGTKNGEGFKIALKGQPEVDGKITTTIIAQNIFLKTGEYGVMVPVAAGMITQANFTEFKEVNKEITNGELYIKNGTEYTQVKSTDAFNSSAEYFTLEDYVDLDADYFPVTYELTGHTSSDGNHTTDSLNLAALAIATKLGLASSTDTGTHITTYSGTTYFDANDNLADEYDLDDLVLTWEWLFDTDGCGAEGNAAQSLCKADTILGNLQAANLNVVMLDGEVYKPVSADKYCLNTQFSIDITVTQEN